MIIKGSIKKSRIKINRMTNKNLTYHILDTLRDKYLPPKEIYHKLKMDKLEFEEKHFYPVLSELIINNYLCYNWKIDENGIQLKYFHLTKNGLNHLNQYN
jgi:DNA-binding PadR family transcriptional regulator